MYGVRAEGAAWEQAVASGMDSTFSGKRHSWNLRVGMLSPDVLDWLRRDPALTLGAAAHEALSLDFSGKPTRRS